MNLTSDAVNSDAELAVQLLEKERIAIPLIVYTFSDPAGFRTAMPPLIEYGIAALFRFPVSPEVLIARVMGCINRRRKMESIFKEVPSFAQCVLVCR